MGFSTRGAIVSRMPVKALMCNSLFSDDVDDVRAMLCLPCEFEMHFMYAHQDCQKGGSFR